MNRALRRISIAVLVMFVLLLANVNYLQAFEAGNLAGKPGNSRAFAAQFQYQRGDITTADGEVIASSKNVGGVYKYQRVYPQGPEYAPATGYDALYSESGIEAAENSYLTGNSSKLAVRNVIDMITNKPRKGATVQLTLDSNAQNTAWSMLQASGKSGAVVALNPQTGAILAMASYPSYDPNQLAVLDGPQLNSNDNKLLKDPAQPLLNRATGATYPPGSTFKIVTSSAAFSQGNDNPSTVVDAPTSLQLPQSNGHLINNNGEQCGTMGDGKATIITAFTESCNTAFANIGMQLGSATLKSMAEKYGINEPNLKIPTPVVQSNFPLEPDSVVHRDVRDRPEGRHGDAPAGGHVLRGHRQQRHADEALPGPAGPGRLRPEHCRFGLAYGAGPAGQPGRRQPDQADDGERGQLPGRDRGRVQERDSRGADRRQDRDGTEWGQQQRP